MSYKELILLAAIAAVSGPAAAQHEGMPPGMSHQEHMKQMGQQAEMKKRGDASMGFDQEKVTHHFHLTKSGGIIEVAANLSADEMTRTQIRDHMKSISQDFSAGIFTSPIATHAEVPLGVPVMRERKEHITYKFEETPNGARVVITSTDRRARTALYEFLKYQIREHATGDPLSVQN